MAHALLARERGTALTGARRGHAVRTWLHKCGDRELFWMMMALIGLLVLGLNTFAGAA
jgi:hypothetical protein